MFPDPGPRQRLGSGFGAFLWCLTAVIFGGMAVALVVAWLVER